MGIDPRDRFSARVEAYLRYRPGYPEAVVDLLRREAGLGPDSVIVDVGSGTGLLSRPFLEAGFRVVGVEPNRPMRLAGDAALAEFGRFSSIEGSAEATTLPDDWADLVTAGQAFHWFEPARARRELARVLKPGGSLALIWNHRRKRSTPFAAAYESLLLEHGTDYLQVDHSRISEADLASFFSPGTMHAASFETRQILDLDGLLGRLTSCSYLPGPGESGHQALLAAARDLFAAHRSAPGVTLEYETRVYWGPLPEGGSDRRRPGAV